MDKLLTKTDKRPFDFHYKGNNREALNSPTFLFLSLLSVRKLARYETKTPI